MRILSTEKLTMRFGGLTALSDFNIKVDPNEIVGLIGPNGSGKTTAFNVITGVYMPSAGKVFFQDRDITRLRPHSITKRGIARTFQNIRLFRKLSVLENVCIGHHLHLSSSLFSAVVRMPRYRREERAIYERSEKLLHELDLDDVMNERADSLPYGKQRRLEIARALATRPRLLLLDEPAAGMNPQESHELMEFIRHVRDSFDLTIFMIEHTMQVVMGVCERIYVLDYGVTIAEGTPLEIQQNQKVIEAYLGAD